MIKDPVCGMRIEPDTAIATREHAGNMVYLHSQECVDKFDADPHRYGHPEEHEPHTTIRRDEREFSPPRARQG